ncbi:MAG: phospholipase D-like domain-containing protein [Pseudomonadota bacterium]
MATYRPPSRFPFKAVFLTALATLALVLFALNFTAGEKKIDEQLPRLYGVHDAQFQRTMGVLLGPPIVDGNRYQVLVNGDRIFPSMLAAIRGAQKTITFETYIYWSGDIGRQFADALTERARAGVKVHILLDWVGSQKIDQAFIDQMLQAGVAIRKFHEPQWYNWARLNNRTHRKLLVVDGTVGFTGGVGIAPEWTGDGQDADHWRDTHFRVEGPVVAQMQAVFMDNWTKTSGEVMHGDAYFPAVPRFAATGKGRAQMFSSSPSSGSESMHLMYLMAITAAEKSIDLSSAYFVPDALTLRALADARERGVRLRIITPGPIIDAQTVRSASRASWGPLLAAGAEMYEYQPTMFHCKVLVVDGLMVSVGSTNFDNRSFRLNDEANLNIYDEAFAAEQTALFEADLARSKRLTLAQWRARPWKEKLMEHAAGLLSSQL